LWGRFVELGVSQQELKRLHVIQKVLDGVLKQVEVAEILSLSVDLTPDPKNTHRIDDLPFGNGFATPLIGTLFAFSDSLERSGPTDS